MRLSLSRLHADRLPDACCPLLATLHDEARQLLSVVLYDEQHIIITLPTSIERPWKTVQSAEKLRRTIAVDCLKQLRNGEGDAPAAELISEGHQGRVDRSEENRRPTGFRPALRSTNPGLRMWPVRLKPWWQRTSLGEEAVLFAMWVLLLVIDCTLAVVSDNWMMLFVPLSLLAYKISQTMISHSSRRATRWKSTLCYFMSMYVALYWSMAVGNIIRHMRWVTPVLLWHVAMILAIYWVAPKRRCEIWLRKEFPLAISVSATDGLFRLHGTSFFEPWHFAMPLSQIHRFQSLCQSPYMLNKTMGTYYLQVQRSEMMENSYVHFMSKDITTLVVATLNHALQQWRQLEVIRTSFATPAIPSPSNRNSVSEPHCAADDK